MSVVSGILALDAMMRHTPAPSPHPAHRSAAGVPYMPQLTPAPGFGTYYPPRAEVWRQLLAQRWRAACALPSACFLHVIVRSAEPTC